MAKKTANPADAHRKTLRKKELKKNKAERAKARDFALVKKDTAELEDEIEQLEKQAAESGKPDPRLKGLKAELEKIQAKKAEYVEEHPEARRLVYKSKRREGDKDDEEKKPLPANRNMFNKKGLPRHPERSIYYDPVMNPFGVPPPGMPYMERPLLPGEVNSDVEMADSDDEDIPLPPGPPPGSEIVQDDEDIPLPDGPPPGSEIYVAGDSSLPPLPPGPPPPHAFINPAASAGLPLPPPPPGFPSSGMPALPPPPPGLPPPPAGFPMNANMHNIPPPPPGMPPPPPGFPVNSTANRLPPPPGMPPFPAGYPSNAGMHGFPPPPPGMPPMFAPNMMGGMPPPPPGFPPNLAYPPPGVPFSHGLPQAPSGFFPRKSQSSASMQDPLSSVPHTTYQAHRASNQTPKSHPSLPAKPVAAAVKANATIEAAPELRDFKKEATAFVPAAVKRKKAGTGVAHAPGINAAPAVGDTEADKGAGSNVDAGPARPDLVSTLKNQFPMPLPKQESKPKDDYAKFVDEMGDLLG